MKNKKGKKHKVLAVIAVLLIAILVGAEIFLHRLGRVTMPEFEKIGDGIYAYSEALNRSNMYLVIGEKKAALIDTANGLSDLPEGIKKITDLPVIVINTHGHYDHTRGNHYFTDVYMSAKDEETFEMWNDPATLENSMKESGPLIQLIMKYQNRAIEEMPINRNWKPLPESGYFDLGGRRLEFFETPGHTPGSISILDRQSGSLFTGDSLTNSGVLLQLPESEPISTYINSLDQMQKLIDEGAVKHIYGGHADFSVDLGVVADFRKGCEDILDGKISSEAEEKGILEVDDLPIRFDLTRVEKERTER